MPLAKDIKIKFSKPIKLKGGHETLGLFGTKGKSKIIKLVDIRICKKKPNGTFHCPKQSKHPAERNKLKKELGIK